MEGLFMTAISQEKSIGSITQVIGPVIDVEFSDGQLPEIYDALIVHDTSSSGVEYRLIVEVQQLLGENRIRAVAMSDTSGLEIGRAHV